MRLLRGYPSVDWKYSARSRAGIANVKVVFGSGSLQPRASRAARSSRAWVLTSQVGLVWSRLVSVRSFSSSRGARERLSQFRLDREDRQLDSIALIGQEGQNLRCRGRLAEVRA